ncbi:MAG: ARMT1-like domain-containing protein [Elusimicrobiota bacterium]|nr:ARMT1-like domain-containing protein [Elusimicrobiota bacterium]
MKIKVKCMECFLRQAVKAAKLSTANFDDRIKAIKKASGIISNLDPEAPPPVTATKVFKSVIESTGSRDAYAELKKGSNSGVRDLLPRAEELIQQSEDPLAAAVKISLCGNIIDYGILENFNVEELIEEEIKIDIDPDKTEKFRRIIKNSKIMVFLSDNAGEIGFDGLLFREIKKINPLLEIIIFVNDSPIINDVTVEDARFFNLEKEFKIVEIPAAVGLDYSTLSPEAKRIFERADYIISKGQANYEILTDSERENIIYILRAKCDIIADYAGVDTGLPLFRFSGKNK